MADGVTFATGNNTSPPNSTKWATDDGGANGQIPIVKLAYSADGSSTLVDADANGMKVNVGSGTVVLGGVTSGTATTPGTAIAYSTSAGTALAANAARLGYNIANNGTAVLYVSYAGTATTSNYVARISTQYDRIADKGIGVYTGAITIVGSAAGTAIVTEW